jgi:hypothetical protein
VDRRAGPVKCGKVRRLRLLSGSFRRPCADAGAGFGLCCWLFLVSWAPACAISAGERSDAGSLGGPDGESRIGGAGENLRGGAGAIGEVILSGVFPRRVGLPVCTDVLCCCFPTSPSGPLGVGVRSGNAFAALFARSCRQAGQRRPVRGHTGRACAAAFRCWVCGGCRSPQKASERSWFQRSPITIDGARQLGSASYSYVVLL